MPNQEPLIKRKFGVSCDEEIKKIRNGGSSFTNKQQFLELAPGGEPGLDGKSNEIWNNFRRNQTNSTTCKFLELGNLVFTKLRK